MPSKTLDERVEALHKMHFKESELKDAFMLMGSLIKDLAADNKDLKYELDEMTTERDIWKDTDAMSQAQLKAKAERIAELEGALSSYCSNITDYHNGYAQAQEDGVGKPLTDNKDVQMVVDLQQKRIVELIDGYKRIQLNKWRFDCQSEGYRAVDVDEIIKQALDNK